MESAFFLLDLIASKLILASFYNSVPFILKAVV